MTTTSVDRPNACLIALLDGLLVALPDEPDPDLDRQMSDLEAAKHAARPLLRRPSAGPADGTSPWVNGGRRAMISDRCGRRDDAIMPSQRVSTCSQILELLRASQHQIAGFDVASLALFGSAARGELGADSDIDFLVEFGGPATFDRYMGLKLYLEDLLGRPIDLVTAKALRPELRSRIAGELLDVT